VRKITKGKAIQLNKKETDELLKNLGKQDRIRAVENTTSNQILKDIIPEEVLSKILALHPNTLLRYRKQGLPHIKLGNKTYYSQKSVYIWLLKQEKGD
jgi:hypothetical protein